MRRLRVRDPSGLCWGCGGFIPYTLSPQKRNIIEKYPRGVAIEGSSHRRIQRKRRVAFELPNVVLDLDAEDSPHVRPFDDHDAAQQKVKWGYNPIIPEVEQRVSVLTTEMLVDRRKMSRMLAARHSPFKISDLDVLSVALLGGKSTVSPPPGDGTMDYRAGRTNSLLQGRDRALHLNGIPERILAGDANTIIQFMLHRQRLDPATKRPASVSTDGEADRPDTFRHAIDRCKSLSQLERLCTHGLSLGQDAISPASVDHIAHYLKGSRNISYRHNTKQALKFVNNFTMRQLSTNAGLNSSMSLLGLALAVELRLLPAVMQYLHICLSQGFIGNAQDKPETLEAVASGILAALEQGQGPERGTRPELFTLLTGRTLAGSTVQPSLFGSGIVSREEVSLPHHIYVQLLGQLGAFRLLWHSWKPGADDKMRQQYEQLYFRAFIRCAEVLHNAEVVTGLDCTTATGDLERDAELDLQAINALDAYHASSTNSQAPYASHVKDLLTWGDIKEVFESDGIHQAAARINDLMARI